jgi:molybdenum cofactor biosynthesis enzyme MoaA
VPSTQHRLDFKPTAEEIAQYVVPHLQKAQNPIASFGQGCEGEPLLESSLIEDSIIQIRKSTRRGVININTNGSKPDAVKRLCEAGLNSMRVSLNSAQPDFYNAYYRPKKYSFDDVYKSIKIARKYNVWVSINYLVFPGFTDSPAEMSALKKLLRETNLNMIQTRNLNIDPAWYVETLSLHNIKKQPIGMVAWVKDIKNCFPDVKLGYFNPTCAMVRAKR